MSTALPTEPASPTQETPPPLLELRGISKEFPGVKALDDVSFAVFPGEVHMLLGENGAGKSSLMKVLCGAYSADSGEFYYKGEKVTIPASTLRKTSSSAVNRKAASPALSTAARSWPTPGACSIRSASRSIHP
jgi:ABC-type uncharacterized transport system ATPase subunit